MCRWKTYVIYIFGEKILSSQHIVTFTLTISSWIANSLTGLLFSYIERLFVIWFVVRQSDDDFRDAENIKNEIENNFDLNKNVKKDGEETLYKAKNLTDSILELRKPVFKTSALLENVKLKKESLDKKFDDLEEFEDKAQRAATQTKDIIHSQK